ncbi:MAG: diphosphomevalonate decarboxylase [Pseudomonadales bacterium]
MTRVIAHPNIALIKYWGKADGPGNIPATPSLSITLDTLCTTTTVEDAPRDELRLNGQVTTDAKVAKFLDQLRREFQVPPLSIESTNNFPTGAGLASSASGFAALITAIDAHCGLNMDATRRSQWARRGSGSAARSVFGGFVSLQPPDWAAQPLRPASDWPLTVVIAITDTERKTVSSSHGMERSRLTSPYYPAWIDSTQAAWREGRNAVEQRDFNALAAIAEHSTLAMHALMISSRPPLLYWNPASLAVIHTIRGLREAGVPVFFTIDAGPQVKAVCLPEVADSVASSLRSLPGVVTVMNVGLGPGASVVDA